MNFSRWKYLDILKTLQRKKIDEKFSILFQFILLLKFIFENYPISVVFSH